MGTENLHENHPAAMDPEALPRQMKDTGGIFYPSGHVLAAFERHEDAERVRDALTGGGWKPEDCVLVKGNVMAEFAQRNLAEHTGLLARLGKSDEYLKKHLEHARRGSTFLLVNAPEAADVERVKEVLREGAYEYAHRYHKLAIENLK